MREFELDRSVDAVAIEASNSSSDGEVRPLVLYTPFVVTPLVAYNVVAVVHTAAAAVTAALWAGVTTKTYLYGGNR
ncbi:MAG: hypothetical protein QHH75_01240 [Bacillota bacterium]|nr:hypothetical protein [Bacillota bacterium]